MYDGVVTISGWIQLVLVAAKVIQDRPLKEIFRLGWLLTQDVVGIATEVLDKFPPLFFIRNDYLLVRKIKGRHAVMDELIRESRDHEEGQRETGEEEVRRHHRRHGQGRLFKLKIA